LARGHEGVDGDATVDDEFLFADDVVNEVVYGFELLVILELVFVFPLFDEVFEGSKLGVESVPGFILLLR